eukprot:NODE_8278_length_408_cov_19.871866_g7804_i0.p1 GENE.NODE_8278_length_408_cov_19.871866_g7804_i0~~NODE_8278_length_408_cov_19.871866_g7804_i0.p1  ORF type:complete len:134 (+),score=22.66 NODE_8278_length_408_cov_19.871866_g7804_i0:46-402(+)
MHALLARAFALACNLVLTTVAILRARLERSCHGTWKKAIAVTKLNQRVLEIGTSWCWRYRSSVGNFIHVPFCLVWILWPVLVPLVLQSKLIALPALLCSLKLIQTAALVVRSHWGPAK